MAENAVKSLSWRRFFVKEIVIFVAILVGLALLWHPDLLTSPIERLNTLLSSRAVSNWHPIIWSAILYFIAGTIRLILAFIRKLQSR